jgi:hypothetical protein
MIPGSTGGSLSALDISVLPPRILWTLPLSRRLSGHLLPLRHAGWLLGHRIESGNIGSDGFCEAAQWKNLTGV